MSKKRKAANKGQAAAMINPDMPTESTNGEAAEASEKPGKKISNRTYLKELEKLEAELVLSLIHI